MLIFKPVIALMALILLVLVGLFLNKAWSQTSPVPPLHSVSLTWTAVTVTPQQGPLLGYNVYRSTVGGSYPASAKITGVPITGTSYQSTGLTEGQTYFYVVRAVNAVGESGNSNEAKAMIPVTVPTQVPPPPTQLKCPTLPPDMTPGTLVVCTVQ